MKEPTELSPWRVLRRAAHGGAGHLGHDDGARKSS